MSFVLGRAGGVDAGVYGRLGRYRALDGSSGAPLHVDLDHPHAAVIVGKRGYGKSYTLGVLAEELARASGVAPVVVDPIGVFDTMAESTDGPPVPVEVVSQPTVAPDSLSPRSWCASLGMDADSGAGGLVWQAASAGETIPEMRAAVRDADAPRADKRAAHNHFEMASRWGVFDPDGLDARSLAGGAVSVLDLSGLDPAPMNAIARGIAVGLYRARVAGTIDRLPWLLVDEAHAFFDGIAAPAVEKILTRGRAPGVSLALATQRPSVVPAVALSQSDLLVAHRLTSQADRDALAAAQPTYMQSSLDERLPTEVGSVLVIDDETETVHAARIRTRDTPHGGASPRASDVVVGTPAKEG